MKSQLSELSALLDGELEAPQLSPLLKATARERALRESWQIYVLIGDQLRQDGSGCQDLTAGVMTKIRAEPVVLAPRNLQPTGRQHPWLALAASVAGVAVVGWLALADNAQFSPTENRLALVSDSAVRAVPINKAGAASAVPPAPTLATAARGDMSEYLLAHHMQSATFRLGDNAGHVRTVTMTGRPTHP